MSDSRVYANPNEVIVDYLKDIRDQLAALNKKVDKLTVADDSDNIYIRTYDMSGG